MVEMPNDLFPLKNTLQRTLCYYSKTRLILNQSKLGPKINIINYIENRNKH